MSRHGSTETPGRRAIVAYPMVRDADRPPGNTRSGRLGWKHFFRHEHALCVKGQEKRETSTQGHSDSTRSIRAPLLLLLERLLLSGAYHSIPPSAKPVRPTRSSCGKATRNAPTLPPWLSMRSRSSGRPVFDRHRNGLATAAPHGPGTGCS